MTKKWWIEWTQDNVYKVTERAESESDSEYWGARSYTNYWEAWGACCLCQGKDWLHPQVQEKRGLPSIERAIQE